jgi:hypothetical protein
MLMNPFVQSQKVWDFWAQLSREQSARLERLSEHTKETEARAAARAREAIDETARLARESLDYATALTTELRQITLASFAKPAAEAEKA